MWLDPPGPLSPWSPRTPFIEHAERLTRPVLLERTPRSTYLIGSLRNPKITELANRLRAEGIEVFDDWMAAGPEADDYWQKYEKGRGRSYGEALRGYASGAVFSFDKRHLDRVENVVLVMPAGKSGHLELGYSVGAGKNGYILFDQEPERWDVMYRFAKDVFFNEQDLIAALKGQ